MNSQKPTLVVANRLPPQKGGGPMGVLRIISEELNSNASRWGSQPAVIADYEHDLCTQLPVTLPSANKKSLLSRYRALRHAIGAIGGSARILQFEFPTASLIYRILHPRRTQLAISEHSRGGVDTERRLTAEPMHRRFQASLMTRTAHSIADEIIWPSAAAAAEFAKYHRWAERNRRKYRIIHNGVRPPVKTALKSGSHQHLKLLIIVSTAPEKNIPHLLMMIDTAAASIGREVHVTWAGGPREFHREFTNFELRLVGNVEPAMVQSLLAECDALITFPLSTIFDLSVLEAMALSVPVIAPRLLGFVEALGEDYLLYLEKLEALSELLTGVGDPEHRQSIGCSLQERYTNHFTSRKMTEKYLTPA